MITQRVQSNTEQVQQIRQLEYSFPVTLRQFNAYIHSVAWSPYESETLQDMQEHEVMMISNLVCCRGATW